MVIGSTIRESKTHSRRHRSNRTNTTINKLEVCMVSEKNSCRSRNEHPSATDCMEPSRVLVLYRFCKFAVVLIRCCAETHNRRIKSNSSKVKRTTHPLQYLKIHYSLVSIHQHRSHDGKHSAQRPDPHPGSKGRLEAEERIRSYPRRSVPCAPSRTLHLYGSSW